MDTRAPHDGDVKVMAQPLNYSGEERHETREQAETVQRQLFEDRAQALMDRLHALAHEHEQGQEIG